MANLNPSSHASLRSTALITSPFWFGLLLAHGIVANNGLPAVGIIPLFASAVSGAVVLAQERRRAKNRHALPFTTSLNSRSDSGDGGHGNGKVNLWMLQLDVVLAVVEIALLVPYWMRTDGSRWNNGTVMLSDYGTAFMMADFAIHLYLALLQVVPLVVAPVRKLFGPAQCNCPSCPSHRHCSNNNTMTQAGIGAEYAPLAADAPDAEAMRESIDVQSESGELLGRSGGALKI